MHKFEFALSIVDLLLMIYCIFNRLISENTVEENILKKANQKRLLNEIAIEGGKFTTATLKQVSVYEYECSELRVLCIFLTNTNLSNDEFFTRALY